MCYGVRTADLAAGVPDFQAAGIDVRLSSDDGTIGHHGLVTDLLRAIARSRSQRKPPGHLLRPRTDDARRLEIWRRQHALLRGRSKRRWPAASASASAA